MTTIQVIMKIIEKIGHSIIKKPDDILNFVKSMLVGEENDIESLSIALSLLETTLSGKYFIVFYIIHIININIKLFLM